MTTLSKLTDLKHKALSKKGTLKDLRTQFKDLCENDKELSNLEHSVNWCPVGGNSVKEALTTKGFDMFALHVGKIIDVLNPSEFDPFEDF
ncbi:hypothetical protein VPEG_00068 [Vibrio phage SIO-2]|uniref:hypothetical protein n=1 Tax=Vibrio phage SIO-2 TaxID=700512 RepID=UPI0002357C6A|nr:hypothetical protein VPEG_00068 [Vibrio phage SIO-2]AET42219.1 hypothetical protein VPEG_00068 [Vibrio phage SIO-2]